jgi:NhaA family Na+:H+ antiporter
MTPEPKIDLPRGPITVWLRPLHRLLHVQAASGVVLMACTLVALSAANSPWAGSYATFWKTPLVLSIGEFQIADTLGHLVINDGLMTLFFLLSVWKSNASL